MAAGNAAEVADGLDPEAVALSEKALANLRRKLLDLSARNSLINYRHPKASSLRVIDELPDQLVQMLLAENTMRFDPVPEPTREQLVTAGYLQVDPETQKTERLKANPLAREWAKQNGSDVSYEMPLPSAEAEADGKHADNAIQTLLYPHELDSRLKKLRQIAESAIQETGANILYLAFGFLEWFEPNGDNPRHAPLFLLPVTLHRGVKNEQTQAFEYHIAYSGEDLIPNLSLREKLKEDFGLALPELGEEPSPEYYFHQVAELVAKPHPQWRVQRHVTLGLLNFSKLLMYLDLDPNNWPEGKSITDHPITGQFLGSMNIERTEPADTTFAEAYDIDEVTDVHQRYPLVDDADSSQHSALIDAVNGKNLVIEGPPGTGKSQTITNLIAAALAEGKTVLFVAEKLAALEVVKSRLDKLGLGDFCLELHSHKTQKKRVLEDLDSRLTKQGRYAAPRKLESEVQRLEEAQQRLTDHAVLVNSPWRNTGFTPHEILTKASHFNLLVPVAAADLRPEKFESSQFDMTIENRYVDKATLLARALEQVQRKSSTSGGVAGLPWYGVNNAALQYSDVNEVQGLLRAWTATLDELVAVLEPLAVELGLTVDTITLSLAAVGTLADELQALAAVKGDEHIDALPLLVGDALEEVKEFTRKAAGITKQFHILQPEVAESLLLEGGQAAALLSSHMPVITECVDIEQTADTLLAVFETLQQSVGVLGIVEPALEQINAVLTSNGGSAWSASELGYRAFVQLVELASSLPAEHYAEREARFDDDALDSVVEELATSHADLINQQSELTGHYEVDALPDAAELRDMQTRLESGGFFRWFKPSWRRAKRELKALAVSPTLKPAVLQERLGAVVTYKKARTEFEGNERFQRSFGARFAGIKTAVDTIFTLRGWYRQVRQQYGVGFGADVAIGTALIEMDSQLLRSLASLKTQGVLEQLTALLDNTAAAKAVFVRHHPVHRQYAVLTSGPSEFLTLCAQLSGAIAELRAAVPKDSYSLSTIAEQLERVKKLDEYVAEWRSSDVDARFFAEQLNVEVGLYANNAVALQALVHTVLLADVIDNKTTVAGLAECARQKDLVGLRQLGSHATALKTQLNSVATTTEPFAAKVSLDTRQWFSGDAPTLEVMSAKNNHALNLPDELLGWLDYLRSRQDAVLFGMAPLVTALEAEAVSTGEASDAVLAGVYDLLATEIIQAVQSLANFSGSTQEGIQEQFRECDKRLKDLQRQQIAHRINKRKVPEGVQAARVRDLTELALIKKECSKKTRHIPLRQLVSRAPGALINLKPCFMMGPMSVAQYLAPGAFEFDMVIMDEASQIRPQDALGAMARGAQFVVVGDPKQMPPSNFFDRISNDEEDDDVTGVEDAESILDAAVPLFDLRRLRWHYRSQHESLIAFSNDSFYDSDLVIFPSPNRKSKGYGIDYVRVADGYFVNRRNSAEARLIAKALWEQLEKSSEEFARESAKKSDKKPERESVGIVAMSSEQRSQIEAEVEGLASSEPAFRALLNEDEQSDAPHFIKNLENVQGDERDVIMISMTYGAAGPDVRVMQRFGPINSDVGWRRLNVLFTRSRKRMRVFSSMSSQDIQVSETSKRGVTALRDFLSYCETGIIAATRIHGDREPDSEFERSVIGQLEQAGFTCKPQVGVAGFFIDIAVVDPGNPGRFLMGVECDGATYHSAKSARDRDRLRQEVLERLGWNIRRIWSTDWFKNPHAELRPIIEELNRLKTDPPLVVEVAEPVEPAQPEEMDRSERGDDAVDVAKVVTEELPVAVDIEENDSVDVPGDLRSALMRLDAGVIRPAYPSTPEEKRVLRPEMLEAFVEHEPLDKEEFLAKIPNYLREQTNVPEARAFLEAILDEVNRYATDS